MSKVIIIGGGIVGLCSAYYMLKAGWEVTVVDKGDLLDNCSYGNAGMIVPSHFLPLAAPGVIRQGIRWLANPRGPLQVRPSLRRDWLDWGIRFIRSANRQHAMRSAIPLRDLSLLSKTLFASLDAHLNIGLGDNGVMMLSRTEEAAEEENKLAEEARSMGLDAVSLSKTEAMALQGCVLDIAGAVHYRCDAHLHPGTLMRTLIQYLRQQGVQMVLNQEVTQVHAVDRQIKSIQLGNGVELKADAFVLAAGAWSGALTKAMGLRTPVMPGRGYSFIATEVRVPMQVPTLLSEARVAITPFEQGIRFGGTMEFGGMGRPVNMQRVRGIVESTNRYFPHLDLAMPAPSEVWHGYRPCSADGLAYIGLTRQASNLVLATGHGMMGLSLGPATGLCVSELLSGKKPSVNLDAFAPDRFS